MNEELKVIISAENEKLKKSVNEAQKEVKEATKKMKISFQEFNDEMQKVGEKSKGFLKGVGTAVAGAATAFLALAPATKELRENQAKLATAFESAGGSAETAKKTYNDLYRVLGDDGQATEAANHLAKLTTNQKNLMEWTSICTGVYATFGDSLPIENLTEAANETAKTGALTGGLADALNWAGVNEEEFQKKLDKTNSEAEREKLIRETLNGLYNEAAWNYEENAAEILAANEAQAKMNESMAKLGAIAAPIMTMLATFAADILGQITPYIQQFAEEHGPAIQAALSGIGEAVGKVIGWIADNWELVSTIGGIILAIAAALSVLSTAIGIVNAVMAASPVTWIVLGIAAAIAVLVAGVILLIKYWDEVKAWTIKTWNAITDAVSKAVDAVVSWFQKLWQNIVNIAQNIWNSIVNIFNKIKETMSNIIQAAKDIVLSIFDGIKAGIQNKLETAKNIVQNVVKLIKSIFTLDFGAAKDAVLGIFDSIKDGIKNKLETAKNTVKNVIDKIKGFFNFEWSLPKLKMPSIKITGKFSLSPLEVPKFSISWNKLGGIFDKPTLFNYGGSLQGIGEDGAEAVVPLERNTQWLDRLATMLNDKMGGGAPIILQVDGKTFAQISVDSINQLTRQTGNLPLKLV